jgi:methionyl-tRNA formyltransferase
VQHATLQSLFSSPQQHDEDLIDEQQPLLLQAAADAQPMPPCTTETQPQRTAEPAKQIELTEHKLTWSEQLQQQQQHYQTVPPLPEASLPAHKQQQQQLPDCWDELDVDSISLLAPTATTSMAPPSSPGGASAASSGRGSCSMLGADREVWLVSGWARCRAVLHDELARWQCVLT